MQDVYDAPVPFRLIVTYLILFLSHVVSINRAMPTTTTTTTTKPQINQKFIKISKDTPTLLSHAQSINHTQIQSVYCQVKQLSGFKHRILKFKFQGFQLKLRGLKLVVCNHAHEFSPPLGQMTLVSSYMVQ